MATISVKFKWLNRQLEARADYYKDEHDGNISWDVEVLKETNSPYDVSWLLQDDSIREVIEELSFKDWEKERANGY